MNALGALTTANTLLATIRPPGGARASSGGESPTTSIVGIDLGALSGTDESDAIYSVNNVSSTKLKIDLYKRVGGAFGLDIDKIGDAGKMAHQIETELAKMTPDQIFAMEHSLGLDKLGVSLREVLDAMIDPDSDGARKLDAALEDQAGEMNADSAKLSVRYGHGLDEVGRYSLTSASR